MKEERALVVLQSFPEPRSTTNPYIVMLHRSLAATPGLAVRTFAWRTALLGRFDVFHAHWPEILVTGRTPLRKAVRQLLFALLLLRLRVTRRPLVRTVHNLRLPEGISRREVFLLRWAQRWTSLCIRLNTHTEVDGDVPVDTVVHGHYGDWYAPYPRSPRIPGRLAFVGQVRHYKGVEGLVDAFTETSGATPELSLRVAGQPSTTDLADELRAAADGDRRISLRLEFLSDVDLVGEVSAAELVVLPYREMHNSGAALTALSLETPILVPDNPVNQQLADEVGPGWVHRFSPPLTGEQLRHAVSAVRSAGRSHRPDLSGRDWQRTGQAHAQAYRRARRSLRG